MPVNELIILVPCHSLEDFPQELGDEPAAGLLNAFAVVFDPALLAAANSFPRYRRADEPGTAREGQLYILPTACKDWVSHSWSDDSRRNGATVISGFTKREEMLAAALAALPDGSHDKISPAMARDFLALGTVYLQTELLTRHMRNYSHLDEQQMLQELLAGSRAALAGDDGAAQSHLRRCFEMLLTCREKFYPVEFFLIDLCLVLPRLADDAFARLLAQDVPVNFLASFTDWQQIIEAHPDWREMIASGWKENRLELIGGDWSDQPGSLMSLDAVLNNLQRGLNWSKSQFGRMPTVWGRKRYGVSPQLPQVLSRLNYTGALHVVMDDGIYPEEELAKLRWQGNDGTNLDAHSRIPLAGDSASSWLRFAVRLAESMDYDHTAGVVIARWPEMRTPWLEDLRCASKYAPVLGKFSTLDPFFRSTDTHGAIHDFKAGRYLSPFLVQSVARREADPVSRYQRYWERERRFQSLDWGCALAEVLTSAAGSRQAENSLQESISAADPEASAAIIEAANAALEQAETKLATQLPPILTGSPGGDGEGLLIINPHSSSRQFPVDWPAGRAPKDGPGIRQRQLSEDVASAIVDLPGCGFQWLPAPARGVVSQPGRSKVAMAENLLLRTDDFEVELSEATGGIAQIRTYRRSPNRLSQQLAFRFPHERKLTLVDGETPREVRTFYTAMQMRESRVVANGPAWGCIETHGDLYDQDRKVDVAKYRQWTTVYRNQNIIRVVVELETLKSPEGDPWTNYFCARFAWKSEEAVLSASMQQGTHLVTAPRIEAPHYLEIADNKYRTTIHTPGLTFHRKAAERMLDTILMTEGETQRRFEIVISLDENNPYDATSRIFSPPIVIPTQQAPPDGGRSGWLFHVGAPNVQLQRILPLPAGSGDEKSGGFILRLLETEGRHMTVPVSCFRKPSYARQLDFRGEPIGTVRMQGDALQVTIAAYELCDVEVRF